MQGKRWLLLVCVPVLCAVAWGQDYSWQKPHAKVLPKGDLEWAPQPFRFEPGESVRYIDFEGGNDAADGASKRSAWKHHPWDPNATGRAAQASGTHTYVFKRGVYYRGALYPDESGRPGEPIRLTSDPDWGTGEAVICGSEAVGGWKKGADHPDIPEADKVWYTDLDWAPRNVWMPGADGQITRIKLARTPNWEITNPDDIKSEWWTWKNPQKPFDNYIEVAGGRRHMAFDKEHINTDHPKDYYQDALLWTTKGWVMGSPFPTRVLMVDREKGALAFRGQWGGISYKIIRGCRYYLEDKPHYLDEPGEFWFDKKDGGGRLYIRLPGDRDPNRARLEVAKRVHMIRSDGMSHVHVSGLTFRFTNVIWKLTERPFWVSGATRDVEPGCVWMLGTGRDIRVTNCRFEHVHKPMMLKAVGSTDEIDDVVVSDNEMLHTDHCAIEIAEGTHWGMVVPPMGRLRGVRVMRNRLEHIGKRPSRFGQGQAMDINYPETLEVAGNFLYRVYAGGINVQGGGKQSGAVTDRPLARLLIHHNKVVDSLLNNDDFGGIETWQGGPAYVYNNISGNPGGYRNWDNVLTPETDDRFGHAYYLDGAFKNYHFNNIAWGKSKGPGGPLANTAAFQEIHSYQNTFFNNTVYNFRTGSRRQAPQAGRDKFLGNIWQGIGLRVFRHARPANSEAKGNEAHAGPQKEHFALETNAYARNVFHDVGEVFGVLEPSGRWLTTFEAFREALAEAEPLADELGIMARTAPIPNASEHDFRPAADSAARDRGVRTFVPWGLYAMVGEWNFCPIEGDPTRIMDEHWYMASYYVGRGDYHKQPMYPLKAVKVGADDYVDGPLENWTTGALSLNGTDQYAVLSNEKATEPVTYEFGYQVPQWATITCPVKMMPGENYRVEIKLQGIEKGMKLHADLNWRKTNGRFAGTALWGGPPKEVTGEGPYVFTYTPPEKEDLGAYVLTVFITTTGKWADRTRMVTESIPKGDPDGKTKTITPAGGKQTVKRTASGEDLKSPQIHTSNFLIEAYFRTAPGHTGGTLIRKMDRAGYRLTVNGNGAVEFAVAGTGGSARLAGRTAVNDGEWHHVIAEADRKAAALTFYVDGREDASGAGIGPEVSLANEADLYVGGTPEGDCLEGALEFLRIARGTLADAKTTIEELYAWQFDGPFLRDFTGRPPVGERDAGAIEAR